MSMNFAWLLAALIPLPAGSFDDVALADRRDGGAVERPTEGELERVERARSLGRAVTCEVRCVSRAALRAIDSWAANPTFGGRGLRSDAASAPWRPIDQDR